MHKLDSKPITIEDFEIDDFQTYNNFLPDFLGEEGLSADDCDNLIFRFIDFLEGLRQKFIETEDKRYWKELIRWLPESYMQTRTVTMTYENLLSMYNQRKFHKLNEWSGKDDNSKPNFISFIQSLPYADELICIPPLNNETH